MVLDFWNFVKTMLVGHVQNDENLMKKTPKQSLHLFIF